MGLQIILLVICFATLVFFSATETAYTSLPRYKIKHIAETHGVRGRTVKKLLEKPAILLTTVLVGNNLANISAAAIVTLMTENLIGLKWISAAGGMLTLIVLIFCEVTPKRLAIAYNESLSLNSSILILWLSLLLRPIIIAITWISTLITHFFSRNSTLQLSQDAIAKFWKR